MAQKEKQDDRWIDNLFKNLMQLGPDLMYGPNTPVSSKNTKSPSSSARNKKRKDQALMNAFEDLLQIEPDLFEELVYMPVQNK